MIHHHNAPENLLSNRATRVIELILKAEMATAMGASGAMGER